jgi:urea transport system ATP-binding protein
MVITASADTHRSQGAHLSVGQLCVSYGSIQTLRDINMTFAKERVTCVMGRNGVGKTTLMKTIMGLMRPTSGSVLLDGQELAGKPAYRCSRAGLALVPQGRQIFPRLTVEENLKVGLKSRGRGAKAAFDEVYELFPILKTMSARMGGDLSGGQQQQLAIARALIGQPRVLLLDEPTEGIQPNIIQQIGKALHKLVDEKAMTIVVVEQFLEFMREFGQDFYIMNRGSVVCGGPISELNNDLVQKHLSV